MTDSGANEHLETTISGERRPASARPALPPALTLVIAWYPSDPRRVGELAIAPTGERAMVLGRGAIDSEPRMLFVRPRPGKVESTAPLASRGLSRSQLELQSTPAGLAVRNLGRAPLRVNGVLCSDAVVGDGDTLGLGQELVLSCVRRSLWPPAVKFWQGADRHRFGEPDATGMLGESPAIWRLRDEIAFAALAGQHVLITGASGSGKELTARAVHRLSPRAARPLVARNASTLPPGLIDAELFGNVRNYPNPSSPERAGLIGQAHGGVLLLDEIGELPLEQQAHLLRVLDAGGEYQRLGESTVRRSDFQLIAATNREPTELRHDLLTRFAIRLEVPELGERVEDVPLLIRSIVLQAARSSPALAERYLEPAEEGEPNVRIDAVFVERMLRNRYPGNTRDLAALLWRAMAKSPEDVIVEPVERAVSRAPAVSPQARLRNQEPSDEEIARALEETGGSVTRAAALLQLSSRYALYRLMTKRRLDLPTRD